MAFAVEGDQFTAAIKSARLAQSAQLDAMMTIHDARLLRLENLRDALVAKIAGNETAKGLIDLSELSGAKPKLWIDLNASVVMEPDPRTYRLQQDAQNSTEIVFETTTMSEMADYVLRFMAHRTLLRKKVELAARKTVSEGQKCYSLFDMIYVWATGCIFGVMALLTIAMYLGKVHF